MYVTREAMQQEMITPGTHVLSVLWAPISHLTRERSRVSAVATVKLQLLQEVH